MREKFKLKGSSIFATVFIGIIIISFVFTGYQNFETGMGGGGIGQVGEHSITAKEYEQEYDRQIQFFRQMTGGELTQKQIEEFKLKESALKNLVQRKLMLTLSKDLGVQVSQEVIKEEIKKLPYFLTDNKFDLNKYKGLLAANNLNPVDFEKDVLNQMRLRRVTEEFSVMPLSNAYLNDMNNFRQNKFAVEMVEINRDNITKSLNISATEKEQFLSQEVNLKRIENAFKERKPSLDKAEEVTARHILLTTNGTDESKVKAEIEKIAKEVTPSNFAKLADKYTQDPSGKGKGGALNTFQKGMMVPEFDNVAFSQKVGTISAPVKTQFGYHLIFVEKKSPALIAEFDKYKDQLVTEFIQKSKVKEIDEISKKAETELTEAFQKNNDALAKTIAAKYQLQIKSASINQLDGLSNNVNLPQDIAAKIFANKESQTLTFNDGRHNFVLKTKSPLAIEEKTEAQDPNQLKSILGRKLTENIIKKMETDTKVKITASGLFE